MIINPSVIEVTDFGSNTGTATTLNVGQSAQGTISSAGDHDWFKVTLQAGHTYSFAQIGTGLSPLGDTYLKLYKPSGSFLSDDNSGPGFSSSITYTAETSGTYYIDCGSSRSQSGQYGVSVVEASRPSYDLPMGAGATHAYVYGSGTPYDWNQIKYQASGQAVNLTYSFRDSITYTPSDNAGSSFSKCTSAEMLALSKILNLYSDICNVSFTRVAPNGYSNNADLVIANYHNGSSSAGAYAYYPSTDSGGDLWLNTASVDASNISQGSYSWFAIMHELGHALGLSHPGDYNAGDGQTSYATGAQFSEDSEQYSIMSYWGGSATGQSPGEFATACTPLLFDIYELQTLYGANTSTRAEDTIYGFNSTAGENYQFSGGSIPYLCIWDGAGVDTINASGYSHGQTINLNGATFSNIGSGTSNVAIAYGAIIENAIGGSGNDIIYGNSSDNVLNGGAGNDTLIGGAGNDTYVVDSVSDTVTETSNEGTDIIQTTLTSYTLGSDLENLTYTGDSNASLTGNTLSNTLRGAQGNDVLNGGAGNDTLIGGAGNDTYVVDSVSDTVTETSNEGTDIIQTTLTSYTLGSDLENLTYTGDSNASLTGNTLSNTLRGAQGNDVLNGGAGNDTLIGGAGNDTYVVDSVSDTVTETSNEGTDIIQTTLTSYTLGSDLENLTYTGDSNASLTGNTLSNTLRGAQGNDVLNGGAGNDTLIGGAGNDTYVVDSVSDTVTETSNEGTDIIQTTLTSYTLGSDLENLTYTGDSNASLTGNTLSNTLRGAQGNDVLNGGAGNDTLIGGAGNDTYVVDSVSDTVTETSNEGTDIIQTTLTSYTLGSDLENLTYTGDSNASLTGNTLSNTLRGAQGNDVLNGGAGNDTLIGGAGDNTLLGGAGDDTYVVESLSDKIVESSNAGTDEVISSIDYTLGLNLENLILTGNNNRGMGNKLVNRITGSDGNNTLNGGAGADTLIGGAGNDIYIVDNVNDAVAEDLDSGLDEVLTTVSYTLANNIESLTLTGSGKINAIGNVLDNTLNGNAGANILDGGLGADTMVGGAGNDIYYVDNASDVAIESSSAGTDEVRASVGHTLSGDIENLTLTLTGNINGTGNSLNNTITGNTGNNILDGGDGTKDTLKGGLGDDTYVVDSATDIITEKADEGTDIIQSSVTLSLAKIAYVEHLTLTGATNINGTGNNMANTIIGNDGANILNGGLGSDILTGGTGNDFFYFTTALNASTNVDTITDFTEGQDLIGLSKTIMKAIKIASGQQLNENMFHSGDGITTAGTLNERIIYDSNSGNLYYDADGNKVGGVAAVQIAVIGNCAELQYTDFVII